MGTHKPLPLTIRSDMYAQLAALEHAGLPPDRAFATLNLPATYQSRIVQMRKLLGRGRGIAESGKASGLFTDFEAILLGVACSAGSPAASYRRLSQLYTLRAAQAARIRSKMMMPTTTLVLALLIQPLPGLIVGTLSLGGYLVHLTLPLLAGIFFYQFAKYCWHAMSQSKRDPWLDGVESLLRKTPWFGSLYLRSNMRDFFEYLALMLEAGMPILDALPRAANTLRDGRLRLEFSELADRIRAGSSFARSLDLCPSLANSRALALLHTGEESGTLPEMLMRFSAMETESINLSIQTLSDLIPKLIYALICAWIAYGILSGPSIVPNIDIQ